MLIPPPCVIYCMLYLVARKHSARRCRWQAVARVHFDSFVFCLFLVSSRLRVHLLVWLSLSSLVCVPARTFSRGGLRARALPGWRRSQAVEKLGGAEVFIGLTGTLIQNELGEFWWIMNMIENGVLKTDAEFKVRLVMPLLLLESATNARSKYRTHLAKMISQLTFLVKHLVKGG